MSDKHFTKKREFKGMENLKKRILKIRESQTKIKKEAPFILHTGRELILSCLSKL